jgi:hypothetical protein
MPFTQEELNEATYWTNKYLAELPTLFESTIVQFYTTLNQRNLSGFIGEVFKHVLFSLNQKFVPNPHPDGRPDILNLTASETWDYFEEMCFDKVSRAPLREYLAPFKYGGVEVKSTIGNTPNAGNLGIGESRSHLITGLNYWAHHAHKCNLLGIYYDYCNLTYCSPQIKGLIYCDLVEVDWHKVSVGRPDRKKTSNTSLNQEGVSKLKRSLIMHSSEEKYVQMFCRLGYL